MKIGVECILESLREQGYQNVTVLTEGGASYVMIADYEIPTGTFAGRKIDLAIPVPQDYPRACPSSIHLRARPHLVDFGSVPGLRNVINSPLGSEWQYWSYSFQARPGNTTRELISQINGVFKRN
ncbi:E2/UBC family protein [Dyadobacter sp. BHUBP1]|uniref:E2/UBC family protein n=1 Tax=Dyadobacter sp. BHUBP1 TaxID=3424178 RepID=UPI003D341AE0